MAKIQDPSVVAAKWQRNLTGATKAMQDGANGVTEAPGQKAAAAADRLLAGVQEAVASGKFQNNVAAVTLEQWKQAYIQKGIPRVSAGVTASLPVMQDFLQQLLPVAAASSRDVASMPKGTLEDSKQRMIRNMENMSRFKFVRRR